MSPLQIGILLHYYGSPADYRDGDISAPAVADAIQYFCSDDIQMLVPTRVDTPRYRLAPRGQAFVEHICSLPLPVVRWEIPQP